LKVKRQHDMIQAGFKSWHWSRGHVQADIGCRVQQG